MKRDMFDTMTVTKIIGGFCSTLLIFLLGAWLADEIYYVSGHYGEQAYVIEVENADGDAAEEVVEVDFAVLMASASVSDGEGLWRSCRSCHALESGQQGTGPSLYGIVNRPVQFYDEFNYSGALIEAADVWTPENLNAFLENPRGYAPGTAMSYSGMRDAQDRANLIAYLATVGE